MPVIIQDLAPLIDNTSEPITQEKLTSYQTKLDLTIQHHERELKAAHVSDTGKVSDELRRLRIYIPFFEYMKKTKVGDVTAQHLYAWLLDWQLSLHDERATPNSKAKLKMELLSLLKAFLEKYPELALKYYQNHHMQLDEIAPDIGKMIKAHFPEQFTSKSEETTTQSVIDWKLIFAKALNGQTKNPGVIIVLAGYYHDQPEAFVALILWLLDNHLTPEDILQSQLLHHFFSAHIAYSGEENNIISRVYQLLENSNHQQAVRLANLAANITTNLTGFENYNLRAENKTNAKDDKGNPLKLRKVVIVAPEKFGFDIVASEENIRVLHSQFGLVFLQFALSVSADQPNDEFIKILKQLLNDSQSAAQLQLPQLMREINRIQDQEIRDKYFQCLSILLDDQVFLALCQQENFSVLLQLLPYKEHLFRKFTVAQWREYVDVVIKKTDRDLTNLPQFFALHQLIQSYERSLTEHTFLPIIEIMLQNCQFIEDDQSFLQEIAILVTDKNVRALVIRKIDRLVDDINAVIIENTRELTLTNYHRIEDAWTTLVRQLNLLTSVKMPFGASYPRDIYALQIAVLQSCRQPILVSELVDILEIMCSAHQSTEQKQAHEKRLLLDWLPHIQVNPLQTLIIERLTHIHGLKSLWSQLSGRENLFFKSVKNGNRLLFNYFLKEEHGPEKKNIEWAFDEAIDKNELDLVTDICQLTGNNALDKKIIFEKLKHAVLAGKLVLVKIFCECKSDNAPDKKDVETALYNAVFEGQLEVFKYFCALTGSNAPDNAAINKARNFAIRRGQLSIFEFSCGLTGTLAPNKDELEWALLNAAEHGQSGMVVFLCRLTGEQAPSKASVNDALKGAVVEGRFEIVKYFCQLAEEKAPDKKTLNNHFTFYKFNSVTSVSTLACAALVMVWGSSEDAYQTIINFYRTYIKDINTKQAADLFNLIDSNAVAFHINNKPKKSTFNFSVFKEKIHDDKWLSAWKEIRELIFQKWQNELRDNPQEKDSLIDLFKDCGLRTSKYYKLMGMRRTDGAEHSETSILIEDIIKRKNPTRNSQRSHQ